MRKFGLPRAEILKKSLDIKRVFKEGLWIQATHVNVYALSENSTKFAVSLSRRIKGAARRNRIKRWIREIYRKRKHELPDERWLLFYIPEDNRSLSYQWINDEIGSLIPKLTRLLK